MGALPHDVAIIEHQDLIGVHDGRDALGDDHDGGVVQLMGQSRAQRGIGLVIERGETVIKDEDLRIDRKRTRNR